MSYTKQTTLWCDDSECVEWIQINTNQVKMAEKQAREQGWSANRGKHYCPTHSRK